MTWGLFGYPDDSGDDPGTTTAEKQQPPAEDPGGGDPVLQLQSELAATESDLLAAQEELSSAQAEVEALRKEHAELPALRNEQAELQERFLRKAAEFDNYRKRTEREKAELTALAKSAVLTELLPVVDACERALQSFPAGEASENLALYRNGVELLYKQLRDMLARVGARPIEALGEKFDPNLHEALVREESSEHEEDTVIEVLRRGYVYNERLLRPAQVKVAVRSTR